MVFKNVPVTSRDAGVLLAELNETLFQLIGNNGTAHVNYDEFEAERAAFMIGYNDSIPICCAGIRPFDSQTAEVKRVYARRNQFGAGRQLMAHLEHVARQYGYTRLILECRIGNPHAIEFYKKNDYTVCSNYPPYVGIEDAVCLEKAL